MSVLMAAFLVIGIAVPASAGFAGSQSFDVDYDAASHTLTVTIAAKAFNDIADKRSVAQSDIDALLPSEIIDAYKANGLLGLFANDAVLGLMSKSELYEIIPEPAFSNAASLSKAAIKADKGLAKSMVTDILVNATGIKCNTVEILDSTNGKILADKAEEAFLRGLPADQSQLAASVAADGTIATFAFEFDYTDVAKVGNTEFTVKVVFDMSDSDQANKLNYYIGRLADVYLKYTIDPADKKIVAEEFVPDEYCALVAEFMDCTTVSNKTKLEILKVLNGNVQAAIDFIEARNADSVVKGLNSVSDQTLNDAAAVITEAQSKDAEKVDKAYDAILDIIKEVADGHTYDRFADMYDGNGVWSTTAEFSKSIEDIIDFLASRSTSTLSKAKALITGTVSLSVDNKVTFEDLFRTTFHVGEEAFSVYLPADYDFSKLNPVLGEAESTDIAFKITEVSNWGKSTDGGATISEIVTKTEAADIDVYPCFTVKFDNGGETPVKEMIVADGYIIQAADIPAVPAKEGYTAGDWYCVEDSTKAPLNFQVNQDSNFTVTYTEVTTAEETTEPVNPPTGLEVRDAGTSVPNMVYVLALVGVVSVAGVVIGLRKKKVN